MCKDGYGGYLCNEYDYCLEDFCENNGICILYLNGYECNCIDIWIGWMCNKWNVCVFDNFCNLYGKCYMNEFNVICLCEVGWMGLFCNILDFCSNLLCGLYGRCENYYDLY